MHSARHHMVLKLLLWFNLPSRYQAVAVTGRGLGPPMCTGTVRGLGTLRAFSNPGIFGLWQIYPDEAPAERWSCVLIAPIITPKEVLFGLVGHTGNSRSQEQSRPEEGRG